VDSSALKKIDDLLNKDSGDIINYDELVDTETDARCSPGDELAYRPINGITGQIILAQTMRKCENAEGRADILVTNPTFTPLVGGWYSSKKWCMLRSCEAT